MCVVNLKKRVKGPVVAWKLLERENGRLQGVHGFKYKTNKMYTSGLPGFQAFVNKKDAEEAIQPYLTGSWWLDDFFVREVHLYNAAQGTIQNMDGYSDGKPGWTASKIRIPKLKRLSK